MARYSGADVAFFLVGGYSLASTLTTFEDRVRTEFEDVTTLTKQWAEHEPVKLRRAELAQDGFFDDALNSVHDALVGTVGVTRVVCWGVEGNTKGKQFHGYTGALQVDYERALSRGELHKARASYQGSGQVDDGRILHELAAETAASGNTRAQSVDNAASTPNGGAGYLQVSALTLGGFTSVTVAIEHSADNVVYADLVVFASVTAAPTAERKVVAGTVNRYLAARWQFNGTGAGQSVTFMAGFARG